ncbi:hypothetical protein OG471_01255 [Streptomyces sp. NBC_01336]|uniref:hypothetical protein n=1 Tax=Streptomyces sp. NBC_01336 TaxID=2903829 RepID=UPI002E162D97|nr:hypothetical protein OG471_01255 [Streptomyces sp. NBC_01336]
MLDSGQGGTVFAALGQRVGMNDTEEGFGLGVDLALGAVQSGLGQAQAVLGRCSLRPCMAIVRITKPSCPRRPDSVARA